MQGAALDLGSGLGPGQRNNERVTEMQACGDKTVAPHAMLSTTLKEVQGMFQLTVLHNHPADPDEFDTYYHQVHLPIAQKVPGVRRFTVTKTLPDDDGSPQAYYLVAVLEWDDEGAYRKSMASAEAQASVDDLQHFTAAGVTFLTGPTAQII